ncbi:MAG: flagellar biosynthesis protein FlgK [Rhodobacteraceae bacterium PARR1]|nr:MAG: flagellar biosynthesis protein FlgK [Rhodobacteraceae bacterium PARR1]
MSNIVDIARTAIGVYRTALGVTGENIANVNTEGYRRRSVELTQIGGAQTSPVTLATGGQGVEVKDIRRAFDQLLADRLRTASGDVESATAHLDATKALEALMLPGTGGIDASLEEFFSGLGKLASAPADTSLRRVVMESGQSLASAFADIGAGMKRLQTQTLQDASMQADLLTADLQSLALLQNRFAKNAGTIGALNPLQDERDRLLRSIGDRVGMMVEYDRFGRAQVSLGNQPGGAVLMDFEGNATTVKASGDDRLGLTITRGGHERVVRLFSSGTLGGLSQAYGAIVTATEELDALAGKMAAETNAVHRSAVDLTGSPGGDLFVLEGWDITPYPANQGSMNLRITPTGGAAGPVTLVRDAAAGLWRAQDAGGAEIGTGTNMIVLPGLTVELEGTASDGDRITLTPQRGRAVDMRFVPTEPGQIAAALSTLTAPAPGNQGAATARMGITIVAPPALPKLDEVLQGAGTGASAVSLLSAGVVGYVPAGTTSVTLASLGAQSTAEVSVPVAAVSGLSTLSVTLDGGAVAFNLTPRPAGWGMAEIAAALNAGSLTTAAGDSLASLGLAAAGRDGVLTLSRNQGDITAASLDGTAGIVTPAAAQGGTFQIFTREGRQIAGSRLGAADIANLLTEANGFLPGASYRPDYLNAADGPAYRGLSLDAVQPAGWQALTLDSHAPVTWSGTVEAAANPALPVTLETGVGLPVSLTLPEGASARRLAEIASAAVPGLRATAETALALQAPAAGTVTFQIEGDNATPLQVQVEVADGRLDALALAINGLTRATGVKAELAPNGDRVILRHAGGADIRLTGFTHSAGAAMTLNRVDAQDQPLGAAITLGAGADGLRVSGRVTLAQDTALSATMSGIRTDSAADPLIGGLVAREVALAGAEQRLAFRFDAAFDGTGTDDAPAALAGPTRYGLTLAGRSVTLDTAVSGAASAADVATGLAALLRDGMPVASMTGATVASLPANGASTVIRVDGQDYVLKMQGGAVAVSGPEDGRVTASFGADNRLRIAVQGGSSDATGITLPVAAGNAAAFGLSSAQAPRSLLTGQVPTTLPASFAVRIGEIQHNITLGAGPAVTLPAGFPGTASITGGALQFDIPASAGALRVIPSAGASAAGFASLGATLTVNDGMLTARSLDGSALDIGITASSTVGQRLTLSDLPPEDLIVIMTGSGSLRMAGSLTAGEISRTPAAVELRVVDAASRQVELIDTATGHSIGTRVLDASGGAVVGGLAVSLTGTPRTGDGFRLTPNLDGGGDGRAIDSLLELRFRNPTTGAGGFAEVLSGFIGDIGTRTAAAGRRVSATEAILDTTERADAAQGAVDLDTEAARLLELQQSYQASAQIMTVAKDLFETLLRAL